jgi:diguanylate cyclase (GGDEF)-like protein
MLEDKRGEDILARIGGEEFALLLTGAGADGAEAFAERLRRRVETDAVDLETPVTVSIGVASNPDDAAPAADLMLAADRALYPAKEAGRNRTVAASMLC